MSKMTPQEMAKTIGSGLLSFPVTPFKGDYSFDETTYRQLVQEGRLSLTSSAVLAGQK